MSRRAAFAIALTAAGLAALLGCDGGDDERAGARAAFIERAGEICERSKARADRAAERALPSLAAGPPSAGQGQRLLRLALRHIRAAGAEIAELEPPPGDEDVIAAYLEEYRAATAELEAIAASRRQTTLLMNGGIEDPFTRADRMLGEYGVEKCSGDGA